MIQIKKYESPNVFKNRKSYIPDMIVLHNTGSKKISSAHYWFLNPLSGVSAHFLVGLDGEIRQYVELKDGAWCNGTSQSKLKNSYYGNANSPLVASRPHNCNYYTVSIECVGNCGDSLTEAQLDALAALIGYINTELKGLYGKTVPIDVSHVIRHCDVNPKTKSDCGKNISVAEVLAKTGGKTEKVSPALRKGDLVSLAPDAVYWGGKKIPAWVKKHRWVVKSAPKNSDRFVIDKSEGGAYSICSAIDKKYLIKEV